MSGTIRKALGPARKNLEDKLREPVANLGTENLEKLKSKLNKAIQRVEDLRDQLFEHSEDLEQGDLIQNIEEQLNQADDKIIEIEFALKTLGVSPQAPMDRIASLLEMMNENINKKPSSIPISSPTIQTSASRLPELRLPKFYGNPIQWHEYWGSFQLNIHDRADLNPAQKFSYLKSTICGKAALVIGGLPATNENYDIAIKRLLERFGKRQPLVTAHIESLNKIPPSTNQTFKLRETLDSIEQNLRALEALGENINTTFLIPIVMSKFPSFVRERVAEICGDEITPPKIRIALERIISNK